MRCLYKTTMQVLVLKEINIQLLHIFQWALFSSTPRPLPKEGVSVSMSPVMHPQNKVPWSMVSAMLGSTRGRAHSLVIIEVPCHNYAHNYAGPGALPMPTAQQHGTAINQVLHIGAQYNLYLVLLSIIQKVFGVRFPTWGNLGKNYHPSALPLDVKNEKGQKNIN